MQIAIAFLFIWKYSTTVIFELKIVYCFIKLTKYLVPNRPNTNHKHTSILFLETVEWMNILGIIVLVHLYDDSINNSQWKFFSNTALVVFEKTIFYA